MDKTDVLNLELMNVCFSSGNGPRSSSPVAMDTSEASRGNVYSKWISFVSMCNFFLVLYRNGNWPDEASASQFSGQLSSGLEYNGLALKFRGPVYKVIAWFWVQCLIPFTLCWSIKLQLDFMLLEVGLT